MNARDAFLARWSGLVEPHPFRDRDAFRLELDELLSEHAKETAAEAAKPEEPKFLTREEWSLLKVGSVVKYHLHDHPIQFKVIEPISMSGHIQGDDGRGRWVWQEDGFTLVSTPDDPQPTPTKYLTEEEFKALKVGDVVDYIGGSFTVVGHDGIYVKADAGPCDIWFWESNRFTLVSTPEPVQVPTPATESELNQAFAFIQSGLCALKQTGLYDQQCLDHAAVRFYEAHFWAMNAIKSKKEDPS